MSPDPRPSDSNEIEDLVVECLGRLEDEGPAAIDALCRAHPALADELRSRVELLARAGLSPLARGADEFPATLGDFHLERRLGAGGMGVVFRATQVSLGRAVALKLIHPTELYFPGARERFRREVETVAQLQHPNVVPIYAVGEERGVPYFAMELVEGASLADVIEALKGRNPSELEGAAIGRVLAERAGAEPESSAVWSGSWIDAVLRIAREAAEALEYVHRRGVVHRDIKPSNVMLTRAGRILLVDFGLARGKSDAKLTRTGSQLGSLAYMAPEQLQGAEVDARADVYALGAVVYELVALRPAFHGAHLTELQRAIAAGEKAKLSTRNRDASDALETVLAKAMAVEPERRYASAADFARDLDNLLARRPIEARRAGPVERVRLWAARSPAEATAAALGLLLFVGAPTVIAWREIRARGALEEKQTQLTGALKSAETANVALQEKQTELTQAFEATQRERDVAEANFRAAMDAVDRMLTRVGDRVLRQVPQMELVRRDLLNDALEFCQRFLETHSGDAALRVETAMARARVADIHASLGDYDRARDELTAAVAEYDGLLTETPDDDIVLRKSIEARTLLARLLRIRRDGAGADAAIRRALDDLPKLRTVSERDRHLLAARLQLEVAQLEIANGKVIESRDAFAAAAKELDGPDSDPNDRVARQLLVQIHSRSGGAASDLATRADPEQWLEIARTEMKAAVELAEALIAEHGDLQMRSDLVDALGDIGLTYVRQGRPAEAEPWLARAIAEGEKLARDFPGIVDHASDLAQALSMYGYVLGELGRNDDALAALRRGVDIGARLVDDHPELFQARVRSASQRANLGWRELELGRNDDGVHDIETAAETIRAARAAQPNDEETRGIAATLLLMVARAELAQSKPEAAVAAAREAQQCGVGPVQMPYFSQYLVQASDAVRADGERDAAERERLADQWLDEAVDALAAVAGHGLDPAVLDDPALARLHDREGWKRLENALAETSH
ncbi:MAG: serine/threonine-protein kinase [Planctomycetes bacterium]|nr:serine/threonine-protein kinase [Planctomycetota bacterium]